MSSKNGERVVLIYTRLSIYIPCTACEREIVVSYVIANGACITKAVCNQCVSMYRFFPDIWSENITIMSSDTISTIAVDREFAEHIGLSCTRTAKI